LPDDSGGWTLSKLTPADVLVAVLLLLVGVYLMGSGASGDAAGSSVVIRTVSGEPHTHMLAEPCTLGVEGLIGTSRIAIEDGSVAFLDSPCPHKLCVRKGRIGRVGEWIACLPNGVVAKIQGDADYDGITP
jgi:hypothetical protein